VRPAFRRPAGPITLHGHCHQKALWGADTSARFLRRLPGASVNVLDTGCCGMAGSFGYTADRYELSMKIGELTLFPALRGLDAGAIVVAPGTSCRHQIHDGVALNAVHPLELAASLLVQ
jgi:Fe-S oxidoreductase